MRLIWPRWRAWSKNRSPDALRSKNRPTNSPPASQCWVSAPGAATFLITGNLVKTLAVELAMASPCATVLAASTAVTAALANAARNRILIKGGPYLESFASVDCICFDKTGTLTDNLPVVEEVIPGSAGMTPERILGMAAASQQRNIHPIARSLVQSVPRQDWPAGNVAMSEDNSGPGS